VVEGRREDLSESGDKERGAVAMKEVEVLVEGGKATPGPPLGPVLGPLGVNVKAVVEEINKLTKDYEGMQVPVKVKVTADGKFEISVGTPPTSVLLKKELGVEKVTPENAPNLSISLESVVKVARMKMRQMLASSLKKAVKEVLGTCKSMGIRVDGKDPREVQREIDDGKYDDMLREEES